MSLAIACARALQLRNLLCALTVLWGLAALNAPAQSVLSEPTGFYEQLTQLPGASVAAGPALLTVGPVDFHPHLTYEFTDGDGLPVAPGRVGNTTINTVSPGVSFNLGKHWTLDYTPTLTYYSSPLFHDTLGQSVTLSGATTYRDWSFHLSQSYSDSTAPYIETGAQTEIINYATAFSAACQLGSKTSLSVSAAQNLNFAPGYVSYDTWSGALALNYQFWPGLVAGASLGGGFDAVTPGSDLAFESFQGNLTWLVGKKLSVQLSGGVEDSQFLAVQGQSVLTPIYSAAIQYSLFEPTSLGLTASRSVSPSLFTSQLIDSTALSVNLRQRLFKDLYLTLSGGYSTVPFEGVEFVSNPYTLHPLTTPPFAAIGVTRQDTSRFGRVSLSFPFLKRARASLFYFVNSNTSDVSGFSYSSHQFGLDLTYTF